ncbi:MAG: TolC family protein [Candidatus Kapabacteria bacterium]|nr:TolC family protein [Ignavibacteriota bacterium]MCW5884542.1 TolC family protein [Candidatus Kapabacteria bacterium]
MRHLILIILLILFFGNAFSQGNITLKEAVEKALLNNYSIRIAQTSNQIAKNNVAPGNAGMLPKVDLVAGYNYANTDLYLVLLTGQRIEQAGNVAKTVNGGVQLSWTILDDMGMFISYERLKTLKSRSDVELKISVENTVKEIARTYYNSLLLKKNLDVMNESIELSYRRMKRIEDRKEYGASNSLELLRAKVDLNTDSTNYKRTELNYKNSLRMLIYLMGEKVSGSGYDIGADIEFYQEKSIEDLRNLAQKSNNSILQALKNKEITELDYELIKTNYMPKVNLTASYSYNRTDADAGFLLVNQNYGLGTGVNLSWNIFDGMRTNIQAQNTKLMSEMNSISIEMLRNQIDMAVINNYEALVEKKAILDMDIANLGAAELNYQRSLDLFDLGQITSLELREAQLNLNRSKMRINESMLDAKLSEIELNILTGTLNY